MNTKEIGNLGEDIACQYLEGRGFIVVERNYWKKWGEIDIVTRETQGKLHFVEVKTVSRLPAQAGENTWGDGYGFSRVTDGEHRPEDNVHPQKLKRMRRVIQSYLLEKDDEQYDWQFDVLTVGLNIKGKTARCRLIEDVVL